MSSDIDLDTVDWTLDQWTTYYVSEFGFSEAKATFYARLSLGEISSDLQEIEDPDSAS